MTSDSELSSENGSVTGEEEETVEEELERYEKVDELLQILDRLRELK